MGGPKRHIQPERYVQFALNVIDNNRMMKYTKNSFEENCFQGEYL
jgi:hypothetical protein